MHIILMAIFQLPLDYQSPAILILNILTDVQNVAKEATISHIFVDTDTIPPVFFGNPSV